MEFYSEVLSVLFEMMLDSWYFWLPIVIFSAIRLTYLILKTVKIYRSGIIDIDKMSGEDFEKFLVNLYRKQGYQVELVGQQGDYGADLVLNKDGRRCVIQAKRWKGKVPIKAVQEVIGARGYYKAQDAKVITNSIFTRNAWNLAKANGVWLIDRQRLIKLIEETRSYQ